MADDKTYTTIDAAELTSKLQEILQGWPLYRIFRYMGSSAVSSLPQEISIFCGTCKKEQRWKKQASTARPMISDKRCFSMVTYQCKNCTKAQSHYFYCWWGGTEDTAVQTFYKAGQFPQLQSEPTAELGKKLDRVNLDLYRKALTSRHHAYGIGALAYLRRVVENRMNDLLDLLAEAAKGDESSIELLKEVEEVKAKRSFDQKISYAARLIPKDLKVGGNPLDLLHELTSEGMHNKSEDECLEIFDKCKAAFEYVFRQLNVKIEDAKAYIEALKEAGKKRGSTN